MISDFGFPMSDLRRGIRIKMFNLNSTPSRKKNPESKFPNPKFTKSEIEIPKSEIQHIFAPK
jgi:hypothetical protein